MTGPTSTPVHGPPSEVADVAMRISSLFDALVGALHRALPAAGYSDLRPTHSVNLFRVIDKEGTRPGELARRAGITPQAMAEIVGYLEKRSYVERTPDPDDGRARVVKLTARGRAASVIAGQVFADLERQWEDKLGSRRMDQFRRMLSELTAPDP